MSLTIVTPPAVEPVTTDDMKHHLRVEHNDDNDYLDGLISAARRRIESLTGEALIDQTLQLKLDCWPTRGYFRLPRNPVTGVTAITYVSTAGVTTTWDDDDYAVDTASKPGRITLAYGESFPTIRDIENAIAVTFTAGHGPGPDDVPWEYAQAIKLLVAQWYEVREPMVMGASVAKLPKTVDWLLGLPKVTQDVDL